jgi:tryptophan 7-halogenase
LSGRVNTVAVVGRDAPAWLAAAALKRSFGRTGLRVQVVELPRLRAPVDVYAAVPSLSSLHQLLGLDEHIVLGACRGVPMVAQRFSNWTKGGAPYFLAYDDEPPPGAYLPFTQYWLKGAMEGLRVGYEEFSLGTACARLGRVPVTSSPDDTLSASYGYQLDALAYSELAKQFALRMGVEAASSTLRRVDIVGDRIRAIELFDETRLNADLYVDASGPEMRLMNEFAGAEFESWAEWLPCDRLLAASAPAMQQLPSFSQVSAFGGGWVGLFPIRHRTGVIAAYSSSAVDDQELAQHIGVIARLPLQGDAVVSQLRPGMQKKPWIGNCVAVGEAAVAADPIDALDLHVAHGCISHLITLFPADAQSFPEAAEYNRTVRLFGSNIRDFQAAHYKFNRRFDEPFWDDAREAKMPDSFQRRFGTFDARAIVTLYDEESFHEQNWAALFLGCGVKPSGYDPRVDVVPDGEHIGKVQQRLRDVANLAQKMRTVEEFLVDDREPAQVRG